MEITCPNIHFHRYIDLTISQGNENHFVLLKVNIFVVLNPHL